MEFSQLEKDIKAFLSEIYPNIEVRVEPWFADRSRMAVYFVEEEFASLYPLQRYHYLKHLIPSDYQEQHMANAVWFELAPGEETSDLEYPDEELISEIGEDVIKVLIKCSFFEALDNLFCPCDGPQGPFGVQVIFGFQRKS